MAQKILLSGMKPTHRLTLGNYLGALRNWVQLQSQYDCIFLAVDLHSITVRQDPKELKENTYFALANYIAGGIDPDRCILAVQSQIPQHAELTWALMCFSYMGELGRMTQYKEKSAREGANIGAGLFTYPVLMAADILLYGAHLVPVGEDQRQHLELTRDIAGRFNNIYGKIFTLPDAYIPPVGARIMDLQDPLSKMGKSDSTSDGAVYLNDSDDAIRKKIKRAVTDSGSEITDDEAKPGVRNLLTIQAALSGRSVKEIAESYQGKQYGHLKVETAERVAQAVRPIRERASELLKDRGELDRILARGRDKAQERAAKMLQRVYERIGFVSR